ncbi:MAG: pyruvate synthase subunit PorA [Candidatus Altiarchaeota archaeon]
MKEVMEASHAVAEAVKAVEPDVIAAYPITPQTHIVERLSDFVANGEIKSEYIRVESEFAAISACLGASATGVRAYTSTSSQGLALMHEILFITSGMRLPVCMSMVNRALSAPINIWNDHQDSFSERDTGWIQLFVETAQEAHDMTIMQHKISEDKRVLLPSMVCMDGFTLSHVYEPVDILSKEHVDGFLPKYKPVHAVLDPKEPLTQGPIGFPTHYMEFRSELCKAIEGSMDVIEEVMADFSKRFPVSIKDSRPEKYFHIEEYRMDDADVVLVAMGSVCGTIKEEIDDIRGKGVKVGLLKIVTYRPFPAELIKKKLAGKSKVAVIEKALSPGSRTPLYTEVAEALYDSDKRPKLRAFVVGLGGRDVTLGHVEKIVSRTVKGEGAKEEWMF